MENRGALVPAQTSGSLVAFDPTRSSRFVERGLSDLERRRTILHVDGHGFIQKVFRAKVASHLEDLEVDVLPSPSAASALRVLQDHRVDLIVSSSLMECADDPGRDDGVRFLSACKGLFPDTPFILYTTPGSVGAACTLADAVVFKNSNFTGLLNTVRRFIGPSGTA